MKRYIFLILTVLLILSFCGCDSMLAEEAAPPTEAVTEPVVTEPPVVPDDYKFTAGTTLCGVDVSGMTVSQAGDAIQAALQSYVLETTINGKSLHFTGNDLGLGYSAEEITAYAQAQFEGNTDAALPQIQYDVSLLTRRLDNALNVPAVSTSLLFNTETGLYELTPSANGSYVKLDTVISTMDSAICNLKPMLSMTLTDYVESPAIHEAESKATDALKKANACLLTPLTYSFQQSDDAVEEVTITPEQILSLVRFDENLEPQVDEAVLSELVDQINDEHGLSDIYGTFRSSLDYLVDLPVKYEAQSLDVEAFTNDIRACLTEGFSGNRPAPRLATLEMPDVPYNGTYVEVNLSAQHLWYYKDGECLVETDVVTGCANRNMTTPNGVYSVVTRRNGAILKGADYETWVRYWMPFYKGYGLHDAYWRDEFGGNEYLYNGSHGCVNIPSDLAGEIFNNISVGTAVIVYGGATLDNPIMQEIWGSESYDVTVHADPFQLDSTTAFGFGELIYTSDNSSVATVDQDGLVTIKGTGTANIIVVFHESKFYTSATKEITINVTDPCGDDHSFGSWRQTIAPTCSEGQQTRFCDNCDMKEHRAIPLVRDHSYGPWTVSVKPGCEEGEEIRTCIVCGNNKARVLAPVHDYGKWKVTVPATCLEAGEEHQVCDDCGHEVTRTIPATGHDFGNWKVVTKATCTAEGLERQICDDCDHEVTRTIPATGHDFDDWDVVTKPTCTKVGLEHQVCDDCGHEVTRTIPATGHDYSSGDEECDNGCGTPNPNASTKNP